MDRQPAIEKLVKFCKFLLFYCKKKVVSFSVLFENNKNILVKLFTIKRGRYSRPFLHTAAIGVLSVGVIASPFLADTFPIFVSSNDMLGEAVSDKQSIVVGEDVFRTNVSQKPRDRVITYTVQKGDTVSTIAEKFSSPDNSISADTIRWANDLKNDNITVGDELKILPVTGIEYKVAKGDSVYSIAEKLKSDPQKIVDFPFNDFANPETFALVEGQKLIVPDGVKPSAKPYIRQQVYIAQGPVSGSSSLFTWPLRGGISQFASWYHMALDITADVGTSIVAAQDGVVTGINIGGWNNGYGTSIWVSDGVGSESHYAHLGGVNISIGQKVERGSTVIGSVGMTGRTTGPHVHFEIRKNGVLVNPLSYLQ